VEILTKRVYRICLMRGDGVGPEIVDAALRVLESVQKRFDFILAYTEVPAGDSAFAECGDALPQESVEAFAASDACLKGPVGQTVMTINTKLRFAYDLYANVRPARSYPGICPPALRPDIDITVIRENSEGFYRALENEVEPGVWICCGVFTERAAKRLAEFAFKYSEVKSRNSGRAPKVTLGTKSNIFRKTHAMYFEIFSQVAEHHRKVEFEHCYADALCARIVREPQQFDIVVSENLLADLISDLAAQVAGGLGMSPATNINYETRHAYFEPTHGSAPDIVGKNLANPIGQIRAAALMLEYLAMINTDARLNEAAVTIESAIQKLLNSSDPAVLPTEVGGKANAVSIAEAIVSTISARDSEVINHVK
jgi:3-isopropylmalate dehydrogenase